MFIRNMKRRFVSSEERIDQSVNSPRSRGFWQIKSVTLGKFSDGELLIVGKLAIGTGKLSFIIRECFETVVN